MRHAVDAVVSAARLSFFFFNDTPPTEIYTLSLPTLFRSARAWKIGRVIGSRRRRAEPQIPVEGRGDGHLLLETLDHLEDRKSTRLNSRHLVISYAVFCLKKKK